MLLRSQFSRGVLIAGVLFALVLSGCAPIAPAAGGGAMSGEMSGGMEDSIDAAEMPMPEAGVLSAAMVRARPSPLEGGNGAAFMVLLNGTDAPVRLQSAATDVSAVVELHETVDENGVMRMIPQPDGFEIPAGGTVELKPGGKHVMLMGLAAPLEVGQSFTLTLQFDNGESLPLSVPVMEMEGMPNMGGMDHGAKP
jgi:copper(I)-binding protein